MDRVDWAIFGGRPDPVPPAAPASVAGLNAEIEWFERYAEANPVDQRRAVYGRAATDLVQFVSDHASEYESVEELRDTAEQHFGALMEATVGLIRNVTEQEA